MLWSNLKNIGTVEQTHISQEKESSPQDVAEQRQSSETERSDDSAPVGVKRIEAATQVWTQSSLIITFIT